MKYFISIYCRIWVLAVLDRETLHLALHRLPGMSGLKPVLEFGKIFWVFKGTVAPLLSRLKGVQLNTVESGEVPLVVYRFYISSVN
jgi:hypothetical protein